MYYTNKPGLHEIVFVELLNNSSDMGNYVRLVEYDNLEGLILCTEITRYKSNLKTLVKQDEIFPVIVISTSNGYDLSYSKIKQDQRILLKECYEYQQRLYKLIKIITTELNINQDIVDLIIKYNFDPKIYNDSINSNINLCLESYNNVLNDSDILFKKFSVNVIDIKINFKSLLSTHLEIKPYFVQKEFKLLIFDNQSLYKLKEILNKLKNIKLDDDINYILECKSSPIYQYKLIHIDLEKIEEKINIIDDKIKNICEDYNCVIEIKSNYDIVKKGEILFS
jgi:translation initiation factor 2 subunit 1